MSTINTKTGWLWLFRMAWRELRSQKKMLIVYLSALVMGITTQVAIYGFRDNIVNHINNESKDLLGADLLVSNNQVFKTEDTYYLDSISVAKTEQIRFNSMVFSPESQRVRLTRIRAIDGAFPYYGTLDIMPNRSNLTPPEDKIYIDEALAIYLDVDVGDEVRLGQAWLTVDAIIKDIPGENEGFSFVGPRAYINKNDMDKTELLFVGLFVNYDQYYLFPNDENVNQIIEKIEDRATENGWRIDTIERRQENIGNAASSLSNFLRLVGIIALLLGGLGVGAAIYIYVRRKRMTIAILRCLGLTSKKIFAIYTIQIIFMGILAGAMGSIMGTLLQYIIPFLFSDLLPISFEIKLSFSAIGLGFITGIWFTLIFAMIPLLSVLSIRPNEVLRSSTQLKKEKKKYWLNGIIYVILAVCIGVYFYISLQSIFQAVIFLMVFILTFIVIALVGKLLMYGMRKLTPYMPSFIWRQGASNLFRSNNQTLILLLALGLGIMLNAILLSSETTMKNEFDGLLTRDNANLFIIDIQTDQLKDLKNTLQELNHPLVEITPLVTMRIAEVNGRTRREILLDSTSKIRPWTLRREFRSTYRDSLKITETLLEGEWIGKVRPDTAVIPISISTVISENMDLGINDTLVMDVQGVRLVCRIASIRDINFNRIRTNQFFLFPSGILEDAPQFIIALTYASNKTSSAVLQSEIVQRFPNMTTIDVANIIERITKYIERGLEAIQFITLFCIITGIVVLLGSIVASQFQRLRESALLRAIGGTKKQIYIIQFIEYFILSIVAAIMGVIISVVVGWLLATYFFEIQFHYNIIGTLQYVAIITILTTVIGTLNMRKLVKTSPLDVLREDVA